MLRYFLRFRCSWDLPTVATLPWCSLTLGVIHEKEGVYSLVLILLGNWTIGWVVVGRVLPPRNLFESMMASLLFGFLIKCACACAFHGAHVWAQLLLQLDSLTNGLDWSWWWCIHTWCYVSVKMKIQVASYMAPNVKWVRA